MDIKEIKAALAEAKLTPEGRVAIRAAEKAIRGKDKPKNTKKKGREIHWQYCAKCEKYFAAGDLKANRKCPHKPTKVPPVKTLPPGALRSTKNVDPKPE